MEPLIRTVDLKKYFRVYGGMLHAVDGVDVVINQGQTLGVVGESGCGKSTLGRLVLRLLEPTGGQIFFEGKDIMAYDRKDMKQVRQQMQIIFQDPFSSLNPRMPVFDLIAEPLVMNRIYKTKAELTTKIYELMEMVGLADRYINTFPHEMDGGRRQRVGVARALALNPKFIVCDEPVSALDVSIQAQILNLLMDLQDELDLTYMFITHDLSVVKHISDEIGVMYLGQCVGGLILKNCSLILCIPILKRCFRRFRCPVCARTYAIKSSAASFPIPSNPSRVVVSPTVAIFARKVVPEPIFL